jgi:hypothetical protein
MRTGPRWKKEPAVAPGAGCWAKTPGAAAAIAVAAAAFVKISRLVGAIGTLLHHNRQKSWSSFMMQEIVSTAGV